jgi:hypothetical protein
MYVKHVPLATADDYCSRHLPRRHLTALLDAPRKARRTFVMETCGGATKKRLYQMNGFGAPVLGFG